MILTRLSFGLEYLEFSTNSLKISVAKILSGFATNVYFKNIARIGGIWWDQYILYTYKEIYHFRILSRWCLNTPIKRDTKANLAFWAVFKTIINHENPYLFGYSSIIPCIQQITNMAKLLQFLKPEFSPDFLGARNCLSKTPPILGGNCQSARRRVPTVNWKKCSSSVARKVGNRGSFIPITPMYLGNAAFVPFFWDGEWVTSRDPLTQRLECLVTSKEFRGIKKGQMLKKSPGIHPRKLTCPLKRDYLRREYIFQPLIFRGHVSFQGSSFIPSILYLLRATLVFCGPDFPTSSSSTFGLFTSGSTVSPGVFVDFTYLETDFGDFFRKVNFLTKSPFGPFLSSRWLNQPIWKICSSNWIHFPK